MGDIINPMGNDIIKVEKKVLGKTLAFEVNRVGFRSHASVLVTYGDTTILGTGMVKDHPATGFDYFPLSIDYEEKMYASGKISGSRFIKREGRPSDEAILIGRLIDRPIRPLWPKGYQHEAQGIATVLSMDPTFRPDMIAMAAVSAALMLAGGPFEGPVAGLRVGLDENGDYAAFLSRAQYDAGGLDLVVAGIESGVMMVEAGANEVSEEVVAGGIEWAQENLQPIIELQKELVKKVGVEHHEYALSLPDEKIMEEVLAWSQDKLGDKARMDLPKRHDFVTKVGDEMREHFAEKLGEEEWAEKEHDYNEAYSHAVHKDVRKGIVEKQLRPDGRQLDEIRPLSSQVGILPRTHGSSLFTRGVTQGMNIVTLAPLSYAQIVDTMEQEGERRYMHHYNAPGWTVGEVKRLMGPGRREIGHGYLAERAVIPVLPNEEDFPYAIRSVTEIMSQNGSTSMAATCSSVLALMDAGVPITRPVSGIAMGLMVDGKDHYVLSDIADAEDFAGDMDFKVTGTEMGITALQMDMKVHGLAPSVLRESLEKGKVGRGAILEHMISVLPEPRKNLSKFAPQVEAIKINPDKIRDVIGKGGEMINRIIAETGAEIDIKDEGIVMIFAPDQASIDAARKMVEDIVEEPEVGKISEGKVVKLMDFGVFVNILPGTDGMVHVSEMAEERVENPADVVSEGDMVKVKLVAIDERGRLNLSMRKAK